MNELISDEAPKKSRKQVFTREYASKAYKYLTDDGKVIPIYMACGAVAIAICIQIIRMFWVSTPITTFLTVWLFFGALTVGLVALYSRRHMWQDEENAVCACIGISIGGIASLITVSLFYLASISIFLLSGSPEPKEKARYQGKY